MIPFSYKYKLNCSNSISGDQVLKAMDGLTKSLENQGASVEHISPNDLKFGIPLTFPYSYRDGRINQCMLFSIGKGKISYSGENNEFIARVSLLRSLVMSPVWAAIMVFFSAVIGDGANEPFVVPFFVFLFLIIVGADFFSLLSFRSSVKFSIRSAGIKVLKK